ncbi:DtxR family Mn-dependent transcriptional regulator [Rhodococcus sp. 27YEA15]|uniref:metal-dependent transcriptional regulator n=1 Tax=Rhodococcus sp. 27YEA15 TaxID=3156259 RepID=UPI003C7A3FED
MRDLINTTEMYLRTVYDLGEDRVPARQIRLIERLRQSSATVNQTVARLKRDGLVTLADGHRVELTGAGRARAVEVTRKHRLAERLLTDILDMPAVLVHDEARRLQHVMSEAVERRIICILDGPTTSPWGNPIPGLDHFGIEVEPDSATMQLADIPVSGMPVTSTVRSISEHAQADSRLITRFITAGVIPGGRVTITACGRSYLVRGLDTIELPEKLAHVIHFDDVLT